MELGWSALTLLCLAGAVAWFWQDSLAAREAANLAAKEACERLGLQFLDGTVAFARLAFTRDAGRLRLKRTYVFDYTATSIERRQGFVLLTARRIESVGFASGDDRPAPAPPQPTSGGVIDLESFRARLERPGEAAPRPGEDRGERGG